MDASWQTWLAAVLCLLAAAYILRRSWFALGVKKPGCGGCSTCPNDPAQLARRELLAIQPDTTYPAPPPSNQTAAQ